METFKKIWPWLLGAVLAIAAVIFYWWWRKKNAAPAATQAQQDINGAEGDAMQSMGGGGGGGSSAGGGSAPLIGDGPGIGPRVSTHIPNTGSVAVQAPTNNNRTLAVRPVSVVQQLINRMTITPASHKAQAAKNAAAGIGNNNTSQAPNMFRKK